MFLVEIVDGAGVDVLSHWVVGVVMLVLGIDLYCHPFRGVFS